MLTPSRRHLLIVIDLFPLPLNNARYRFCYALIVPRPSPGARPIHLRHIVKLLAFVIFDCGDVVPGITSSLLQKSTNSPRPFYIG